MEIRNRIGNHGWRFGIGDSNWGLGLGNGFGIGNKELGLSVGTGDWDWILGLVIWDGIRVGEWD